VRLTPAQTDIFQELVNIGVGKAADALHDMLGSQVQLTVPMVKVVTPWELKVEMASIGGGRVVTIQTAFTGPFSGVVQALFPSEDATQILSSLSDEEREVIDIGAVRREVLTEIGNITANGVLGSIGNVLGKPFKLFPPYFVEDTVDNLLEKAYPDPTAGILLVQTHIKVGGRMIEGRIRLLVEVARTDELMEALDSLESESP
jgi:chemotaxis protein CheC